MIDITAFGIGAALAVVAGLYGAYLLLDRVVAPWDGAREQARLDALITPLGPEHYRFTGQDDALPKRAAERRVTADKKRHQAELIAAGIATPKRRTAAKALAERPLRAVAGGRS